MKTFVVFKHYTHGFEAVKVGFSWPALFFGPIWMLVKKLWGLAGLWLGILFVFNLIENFLPKMQIGSAAPTVYIFLGIAHFAFWLVPPFKGNGWREKNLRKRGFKYIKDVQAENSNVAVESLVKSGDYFSGPLNSHPSVEPDTRKEINYTNPPTKSTFKNTYKYGLITICSLSLIIAISVLFYNYNKNTPERLDFEWLKIENKSFELLYQKLNDKHKFIRINAVYELGKIEDPRVVETLIRALNDDDPNVRASVVITLKGLKDNRIEQALNDHKNDKDAYVRNHVLLALDDIRKSKRDHNKIP